MGCLALLLLAATATAVVGPSLEPPGRASPPGRDSAAASDRIEAAASVGGVGPGAEQHDDGAAASQAEIARQTAAIVDAMHAGELMRYLGSAGVAPLPTDELEMRRLAHAVAARGDGPPIPRPLKMAQEQRLAATPELGPLTLRYTEEVLEGPYARGGAPRSLAAYWELQFRRYPGLRELLQDELWRHFVKRRAEQQAEEAAKREEESGQEGDAETVEPEPEQVDASPDEQQQEQEQEQQQQQQQRQQHGEKRRHGRGPRRTRVQSRAS
eukprot:COSAG04_NODE_1572_length_6292_cov_6.243178_5_plen_269_part_00